MTASTMKYIVLFGLLACLTGCKGWAIQKELDKGNAVVIFSGKTSDIWINKEYPKPEFYLVGDGFQTLKVVKPGTYVFYSSAWNAGESNDKFYVTPRFLTSSLGISTAKDIEVVAGIESRIVSRWHPEERDDQPIYNNDGVKIGSTSVLIEKEGYRDVKEYYKTYKPATQLVALPTFLNGYGEANFASFEVKAGEIIILDKFYFTAMERDFKNCTWLQDNINKLLACPISMIEFEHIPFDYSTDVNKLIFKLVNQSLSPQQIQRIEKRPISLGALVRKTPVTKGEDGYDTYILNAEKTSANDYKLTELK